MQKHVECNTLVVTRRVSAGGSRHHACVTLPYNQAAEVHVYHKVVSHVAWIRSLFSPKDEYSICVSRLVYNAIECGAKHPEAVEATIDIVTELNNARLKHITACIPNTSWVCTATRPACGVPFFSSGYVSSINNILNVKSFVYVDKDHTRFVVCGSPPKAAKALEFFVDVNKSVRDGTEPPEALRKALEKITGPPVRVLARASLGTSVEPVPINKTTSLQNRQPTFSNVVGTTYPSPGSLEFRISYLEFCVGSLQNQLHILLSKNEAKSM